MKKIIGVLCLLFVLSLSSLAAEYNGYIVKIKENALEELAEYSLFSENAYLFSEMDDSDVVELLSQELDDVSEINSDHMLLKAVNEDSLQVLIDLGLVEYYEENVYAELYGYDYYANPEYVNQQWYFDAINVDFAWNAGIFGNDTRVAVIDSGVYMNNDIKNNIIPGINYLEGETVTDTGDALGHGTNVAGLIASQCNTSGIVGTAFKTKIVPLKVTNQFKVEIALIVDAIYDAVDEYDCDVINMSLGISLDNDTLYDAVNYALNRKVIVVAAAGNDGDTGYRYPASYDGVISVANAQKINNGFSIFSSSQKNDKIDIAVPGTEVLTLSNSANGVMTNTGTSFAAPIVSAVAALAKSVDPDIDSYEFERLVRLTANDSYILSSGQNSNAWGKGMIDVEAFFKELLKGDYYVSKKLTVDNKTSVYVTNFTDASVENGKLVVREYNESGELVSVSNVLLSLDAYESKEFSLTDNGFSQYAKADYIGLKIPGDVNLDGEISIRDASVILRYLADYSVDVSIDDMDVNGDGEVNIRDASAILRHLAGFAVELH